ncbi:hypothetical protein B0H11DRAFT_1727256 [Mycena galericulata]|nr:hypothetical protein B0H11DRAFT_1727256 [Mycena galericulata]
MDRVKHLLSGGFWWNSQLGTWTQAATGVQNVLHADAVIQRHLGWVSTATVVPGKIEPAALTKNPPLEWCNSAAGRYWNSTNDRVPEAQSIWRRGRNVTAQSGDRIAVNNWVVAKDKQGLTIFGRVYELLTAEGKGFVTLEHFTCSEKLHQDFSWPILRRPTGAEILRGINSFLVLPSSNIQFGISVQHDCRRGECQVAISGKERQEREVTARDKSLIKHQDDDHFIINMGGLHNFPKLCRALPAEFSKLELRFPEREEFHKVAAQKARRQRDTRRKKTAAKRRQNAEAKKQEALEAEMVARQAEQAAIEGRNIEGEDDEEEGSDAEGRPGWDQDSDDEEERAMQVDNDNDPESGSQPRGKKRQRRG